MDQKEEFESALATASAKALGKGQMSESDFLIAMAPARIPEMDRMLNCAAPLSFWNGSEVGIRDGSCDRSAMAPSKVVSRGRMYDYEIALAMALV